MPNYVKNIVHMEGIANLPLFAEEGEKKHFDFNKLIPMPEALDVVDGSETDENIVYFLTERCAIPIVCLKPESARLLKALVGNIFSNDWPEEVFRRVFAKADRATEEEQAKMYKAGETYISNYKLYGATTWYGWCPREWGTKWNAISTQIIDDDTITFETAWSNPEPVLRKLAAMYPEAEIEHWWADEDMGSNTGHRRLHNDAEDVDYFDSDQNAYEIYVKCWGMSECLYRDENGALHRKDCDTCHGCD